MVAAVFGGMRTCMVDAERIGEVFAAEVLGDNAGGRASLN